MNTPEPTLATPPAPRTPQAADARLKLAGALRNLRSAHTMLLIGLLFALPAAVADKLLPVLLLNVMLILLTLAQAWLRFMRGPGERNWLISSCLAFIAASLTLGSILIFRMKIWLGEITLLCSWALYLFSWLGWTRYLSSLANWLERPDLTSKLRRLMVTAIITCLVPMGYLLARWFNQTFFYARASQPMPVILLIFAVGWTITLIDHYRQLGQFLKASVKT